MATESWAVDIIILPDCQPVPTEHFQSPLYGSGTVFCCISHLLRHFPSSALAWRHTPSNSATRNYCSRAHEATLSFMDTLIAITYLLTLQEQQILHKLGVTVHGVSKIRLPSTSWTAATPQQTLPVVSDFNLPAATISSYHDIVTARSAVRRSQSPVWWPGMRCLMTSETRHSVPTISGRS